MLTVFFFAYYMKLLARVSFFSESYRDGENGYVSYYRVYNELIIPVRAKICNLASILNWKCQGHRAFQGELIS